MLHLLPDHESAAVAALPPTVVKACQHYGRRIFIAGGFLRAVVARESISDVDIFTEATVDHAQLLYIIQIVKEKLGRVTALNTVKTANAISIDTKPNTQIISRFTYSLPAQCIASFDFTICQAALWWDLDSRKWQTICNEFFYPDVASRRLRYTGYKGADGSDPINTATRVLKFYERGYVIDQSSYRSIMLNGAMTLRFDQSENGGMPVVEENKILLTKNTKTY